MKKYSIPDHKDNLTWACKPDIFNKSRVLRKSMSPAEKVLWRYLRNNKLGGLKFRKQHLLDIFIADFYCHKKKLIIGLCGGINDTVEQRGYNDGRSFELEEKSFKMLRFRDEGIISNIEYVLSKIKDQL
jgi:very-short-patch-repair endonuclease